MSHVPFTLRRRLIAAFAQGALALTAAGWLAPTRAIAQDDKWPSRPVRMIVPFPAGSFTDTVARVLSEHIGRSMGQPVVVENKAGANGVIGVSEAARSAPDGYTLLVTNSSSITINPQIYKKVPYRASDFMPVTMVLEAPFILVANPDWAQKNNIRSVKDLVQFAGQHPGKLSYGSAGPGNIAHLSLAMLSNREGVKMTHIPYKSAAAAQMALLSGELDALFDTWTALPHIKAGKLKPLAVTSSKRMAQLPEVPTMEQSGIADFVVTFWIGMLVPAGTPPQVVQKLNTLAQELRDDAKAKAVLAAQGDVVLLDPASFAKRIDQEVPTWGAVIQREAVKLD